MSDSYEFKIKATETGRIDHTPYRCRANDENDTLRASLARVTAELAEERMKAGRLQARCSVFMQAMAWLARNGHQERAQRWVARADESAADVRQEDFVVARTNGASQAPDKGASDTGMPGDD
jgi:hypothetical protein